MWRRDQKKNRYRQNSLLQNECNFNKTTNLLKNKNANFKLLHLVNIVVWSRDMDHIQTNERPPKSLWDVVLQENAKDQVDGQSDQRRSSEKDQHPDTPVPHYQIKNIEIFRPHSQETKSAEEASGREGAREERTRKTESELGKQHQPVDGPQLHRGHKKGV